MIIVEGIDGSGKTRAAQAIAKHLGMTYTHEKAQKEGFYRYVKLALTANYKYVSDRFHLSEGVYPIVKQDGRLPMLLWQQHMVERVLQRMGCMLVFCHVNQRKVEQVFRERGEGFVTAADIPLLDAIYLNVVRCGLLPTYTYDFTLTEERHMLDVVSTEYNKLQIMVKEQEGLGGIGTPDWGCTLLVGDQHIRGLTPEDPTYAPFSEPNGSSLYLHQALQLSGRRDFHITNATKYGSPGKDLDALHQEVALLKPRRIVALGNRASQVLVKAGICHEQIEHPSARKRFKYEQITHYAERLGL